MISIEIMENRIRNYSWGSFTAIPDLLGQKKPSDVPQAELWMGAHPSAPSFLNISNEKKSLIELIDEFPEEILGKKVYQRFGKSFPFLFKILAADKPLSIQVHPNLAQAKKGFKKENKQKMPLDSEKRNYKDAHHKPECICALTDFCALIGFRKISNIIDTLEKLSDGHLDNEIRQLKNKKNPKGLKQFFHELMTIEYKRKEILIDAMVVNAEKCIHEDNLYKWVLRLYSEYGQDMGIIAPLLLNLICIKPGEAVYLPPGELHAYLEGVCIELMANSDNVIRGGLTSKYMDIPELLHIVNFAEKELNVITPNQANPMEKRFPCPVKDFILSRIHVHHQNCYSNCQQRSVEIIICIDGSVEIKEKDTGRKVNIEKGVSVLIPAFVGAYQINGEAILYKAGVPL